MQQTATHQLLQVVADMSVVVNNTFQPLAAEYCQQSHPETWFLLSFLGRINLFRGVNQVRLRCSRPSCGVRRHLCSGQQQPVLKLSSPTTNLVVLEAVLQAYKLCTYCLRRLLANMLYGLKHSIRVGAAADQHHDGSHAEPAVHELEEWKNRLLRHACTKEQECLLKGRGVAPSAARPCPR